MTSMYADIELFIEIAGVGGYCRGRLLANAKHQQSTRSTRYLITSLQLVIYRSSADVGLDHY